MFVAASLMGISLFSACKKDDSKSVASKDVAKTLMGKKWRLTDYKYTYKGTTVVAFLTMPPCQKDNTIEFKSGAVLEGGNCTKCDPSEDDVQRAKWELRASNTEIYMSDATPFFGLTDLSLTILTLNSKVLKVKYITTIGGPSIESEATYAPM